MVTTGYDPDFPRAHYDRLADDEWTRLTRSRRGELNFLVHMDVLRTHITTEMDVLEVGAGAGIYTKELVHMARRLVVSAAFNKAVRPASATLRVVGTSIANRSPRRPGTLRDTGSPRR